MVPEVAQRKSEIEALCREFGVLRLELFGSAATGNFTAESDLDFLVEFTDKGPGYFNRFFDFMEALERLFGRKVDLVSPSAIRNPVFKASVEESRTLLYAA